MSELILPSLVLPGRTILEGPGEQLWRPGTPLGIMADRIKEMLGGMGFELASIEGISDPFGQSSRWGAGELIAPRGFGKVLNLATAKAQSILDHLNGKTSDTLVTPNYIALLTATALAADTGVTITTTNNVEATYTSYARLSMAATDYPASSAGGAPPTATASAPIAQKTWPGVTGGSNTLTNWCVVLGTAVTRANAGAISFYGTCTSTAVSTTQTPPTVAANGFTFTDT